MFETKRLVIRLMEERDLETVRQLHNEESTLNKLSDPFHVTWEEQVLWFQSLSKSRKNRRYVLEHKDSERLCGIIRLDDIDLINRSATIGADIEPAFRGNGLAKEAYNRILNYLFKDLGLNRLQLVTMESNKVALSLYVNLGFQQEGRLREGIYRAGKYSDLLLMSLLEKEWISEEAN